MAETKLLKKQNIQSFYVIGFIEEWLDELPQEGGKYKYIILDYDEKWRNDGFYDGNNTTSKIDYFGNKISSAPNETETLKKSKKYPTFKIAYDELIKLFKRNDFFSRNDFEYIIKFEKINTINDIPLENKYMITNVYCIINENDQFDSFGLVMDLEFEDEGYIEVTEIRAYTEEE